MPNLSDKHFSDRESFNVCTTHDGLVYYLENNFISVAKAGSEQLPQKLCDLTGYDYTHLTSSHNGQFLIAFGRQALSLVLLSRSNM